MYSLDLDRAGDFPEVWRNQSFAGMVAGRNQAGVLFLAQRRSRNLCRGCFRSEPEADYIFQGPGCFAGLEPQDGRTNRMGQRADRAAAGLHHGSRRHQRAAAHRPGLRGLSGVVAERAVSGGFVDAQIWPGSAGGAGHLHHGHRQQAVGATDPRWRAQRFPVLVAGRTGTSFSSPAVPAACRYGPCWPMVPIRSS